MLDFSELSPDGRDLELLTRELCLSLGYNVSWSGVGTDAGRDLLIEEVGDPLFGGKHRRWLVSRKSTAAANQGAGRSVGLADLGADGGILDSIEQHASDAYLLVCATQPSSAVVSRLEALEARSGKPMHIWDAVQLERLLTSPRNWRIAQHFLPVSSEASGLKVFYTESPNKFVVVTRGFYILAENRHGSYMAYQLSSIDMRLDRMEKIQATLPPGAELRPRMMWCDDKHGAFLWHFDYLYERGTHGSPGAPPGDELIGRILAEFGDGAVTYDDGQPDSFVLRCREVSRWHDAYDPDHYSYYRDLGY